MVVNLRLNATELGNNMRLYSRKNKEDLFDIFEVHLNLPTVKCSTQPGNEWGNDYPTKCVDLVFTTGVKYRKDDTWTYFECTLFGFGFNITRQTGY